MKIFLYCSFKSSNGFKEATLDMQNNELTAGCVKSITDIFYNVPDDAMLLSEDMQGNLLFSILGEKTDDYGKYLNIIFCDSDYDKICNIFAYTLRNYDLVTKRLFSAIEKDMSIPKIEYKVDADILHDVINTAQEEGCRISNVSNKGVRLLSYISLHSSSSYYPDSPWSKKLFPGYRNSGVMQAGLVEVRENVNQYMERLIELLEGNNTKIPYRILLYVCICIAVCVTILLLFLSEN